ncbi:MAG: hypothetical protein AAF682_25085 [Planctomycetota bacterium]
MAEEPEELDGEQPDANLDEDLFNFDEVMPAEQESSDEDIDLDEIFAAFEDAEDDFEKESLGDFSGDVSDEDEDDSPLEDLADAGGTAPEPSAPAPAAAAPAAVAEDPLPAFSEPAAPPAEAFQPPPVAPAADPLDSLYAEEAPNEPRRRGAALLTTSALAILFAMTLLNMSVGFLTLRSAKGMKADIDHAANRMAETAIGIREHVSEQADSVKEQYSPVVPPTPERHIALDRALADIETGNFARSRERIYALLAIADRLAPGTREDVEARASYLLARSYHSQALSTGGRR